MLIIGHRGASGCAPENTCLAFDLAFEQGADGIECDIIQHQQECYVLHDMRLERTTNGHGYLRDHDHDSLRQIDAGQGQKIPTMAEVINCIPDNRLCNLEIKYLENVDSFIFQLKHILAHGRLDISQLIVSSFHHGWLGEIRSLWPQLHLAYLVAHYPSSPDNYLAALPGDRVNVALDIVDAELIAAAHRHNKSVWVYTVNHQEDMQRCLDMGADGIFTNYPDVALTIEKQYPVC